MFLILIRHGETTANQLDMMQGTMDFPLSFEGKQEILEKRDKIYQYLSSNFDIKRVFTSDLKRAFRTADLIFGGKKVAVTRVFGLREFDLGEGEGCTKEQFGKMHPEHFEEILVKKSWNKKYPKGESRKECEKRVWNFTKKRVGQLINSKKSLVFVTHNAPIRFIAKNLFKLSEENYSKIDKPKNLQVDIFEIGGSVDNFEVLKHETINF